MTKLNGISMIPFGLLSAFCSGQEIRITELSEEGFFFSRTGEDRTECGTYYIFF